MADIPATPSDGQHAAWFVSALEDPSSPQVSELSAESVTDLSCYLTGDGLNLTSEQATITDERLCTTQVFEVPGRKTNTAEVTYIDNTNSEHEGDTNEAAETLTEGQSGFIVTRRGVPYEEPISADQMVSVWPIRAGSQRPVAPEANSVIRTIQKLFVTGNVHQKIAVTSAS